MFSTVRVYCYFCELALGTVCNVPCQVISILRGFQRLKVVLIKGQEMADNVPEKDPSLTSSIYQTAYSSITPRLCGLRGVQKHYMCTRAATLPIH